MKKELKILLFINSFIVFSINLFSPFYAIFVKGLTNDVYHIGTTWSIFVLSAAIFTFILSRYENNKKHADYILILSFIFRAIGWTSYIFLNNLFQLYVTQIILALAESLGTPSFNLLYSSFLTKGKYASDWGMNTTITFLIVAVASALGGIIVQNFGFKILFILMIILSFISMIIGFMYKDNLQK